MHIEAEAYKQQLDRIDQSLRGILPVIQQQSKEIDELLDIYEKSVSFTNIYVDYACWQYLVF